MRQDTAALSAQAKRMKTGKGIVAALDQSGGSIPKALRLYGVSEDSCENEVEMIDEINAMRKRIVTAPAFTSDKIIGAIIFRQSLNAEINGKPMAEALWEDCGVVPFLKIDDGLDERNDDVQVLKPIPGFRDRLLAAANAGVFGTKKRSVIYRANVSGIKSIVAQQFVLGREIMECGLVPIIEPEVDIGSDTKAEAEEILRDEILAQLNSLSDDQDVLLKMSLPSKDGFYDELANHPRILRVMALSGGYSNDDACARLAKQRNMIASFSRALLEGLSKQQNDSEFHSTLAATIDRCYRASFFDGHSHAVSKSMRKFERPQNAYFP